MSESTDGWQNKKNMNEWMNEYVMYLKDKHMMNNELVTVHALLTDWHFSYNSEQQLFQTVR